VTAEIQTLIGPALGVIASLLLAGQIWFCTQVWSIGKEHAIQIAQMRVDLAVAAKDAQHLQLNVRDGFQRTALELERIQVTMREYRADERSPSLD
jgi:hypothetical protein